MTIGQLVIWRGETVKIVRLRKREAQIARPGYVLRWVHLSHLEVRHEDTV